MSEQIDKKIKQFCARNGYFKNYYEILDNGDVEVEKKFVGPEIIPMSRIEGEYEEEKRS